MDRVEPRIAPRPPPKAVLRRGSTIVEGIAWNVSRHGVGFFTPRSDAECAHFFDEAILRDWTIEIEIDGLATASGDPRWYGPCVGGGFGAGVRTSEALPEVEGVGADGEPMAIEETWSEIRSLGRNVRMRGVERLNQVQSLFEDAPIGLYRLSPERTILVGNAALAKFLGCGAAAELVGRAARDFYVDPDQGVLLAERIRREGAVYNFQMEARRTDGSSAWARLNARALHDPVGRFVGYQGSLEDVTEERRLARATSEALRRGVEGDELKRAFLRTLSHEVRTPLSVIVGFADFIATAVDREDSTLDEAARAIEDASNRLVGTIHGVLDLAKTQTGQLPVEATRIDVAAIVTEGVRRVRKAAESKGLDLECERTERVWANADAYCVEGAVRQLLDNAIKFTESGVVSVRVSHDAERGSAVIEIEDTGIGIGADFQSKLFQPFRQEQFDSTRQYEGLGIGLALVKEYVEACRGRVSAESAPGRGSTFRIELPAPEA